MEESARAILARVMFIRDDLDAGRLTREQAKLYNQLGRQVELVTKNMDVAGDSPEAEALWHQGAELIHEFMDEHFPCPTRH